MNGLQLAPVVASSGASCRATRTVSEKKGEVIRQIKQNNLLLHLTRTHLLPHRMVQPIPVMGNRLAFSGAKGCSDVRKSSAFGFLLASLHFGAGYWGIDRVPDGRSRGLKETRRCHWQNSLNKSPNTHPTQGLLPKNSRCSSLVFLGTGEHGGFSSCHSAVELSGGSSTRGELAQLEREVLQCTGSSWTQRLIPLS